MASLLVFFLIFLCKPLHPTVWTHPEFQFNDHKIKWPRWSETWNQYPERGPHPDATKQLEWPWTYIGIGECPILITIPVSSKETWPPWDSVLPGNTGDFHQRWESSTTSISHMTGANCGSYGARWQSWPNRSHSDQPRSGHPAICVAVIRRRTEFGWGMRHHVYTVRCHQLGWQMSPTQCQASKPGWWLVDDEPSHHWRTH